MIWPKALVAELASRRCIIFLGAGASVGCMSSLSLKKPPTWSSFLSSLIFLMKDKKDRAIIKEYIKKGKFLEAAEIICSSISPADFASFIREKFVSPRYNPSKIHERILQIDPKILITTNYDDIYDSYCRTGDAPEGYNISRYYDSHIVADLRSPVRLIIKAHGCISDPSKIILTKSQYFHARQNYREFYNLLESLFTTHTILFIGYSLTDPDIQMVLENTNISAPSAYPHYFVTQKNGTTAINDSIRKSYNIEFIEFENGKYDELNEGLLDLSEKIKSLRMANPLGQI